MRLPVVAIVGRPNVGKSTLFNRLTRRRMSIVEDTPGVTRDRLYAETDFDDLRYVLIDTGGFEADPGTELFAEIRGQAQLAVDEADLVVLVVDARAGVTPPDIEVARILRRAGRPLFVAANKMDSPKQHDLAAAFYELGVDAVHPISAEHGLGVADLMDALFEHLDDELREHGQAEYTRWLKERDQELSDARIDAVLDEAASYDLEGGAEADDEPDDEPGGETGAADEAHADTERSPGVPDVLRVAVIGRPNVGKSSLVNRLLGEERQVVSAIAGTTTDAVDSFFEHGGRRYRLIDTAGIRRKRSISAKVERFSVVSALKAMDRADVTLLLLDATHGIAEQDLKIAAFAHDKGKAIIIVVNKWDLSCEHALRADEVRQAIRDRASFLSYAPIRFVSAKTGRRVFDLLDTVQDVARAHFHRVKTAEVNRVLRAAVAAHQPPVHRGRRLKLYFGAQVRAAPPTFVFACNDPKAVHFSYRRFLTNRLREAFGFSGAPIRLILRQRGSDAGRARNKEARARTAARADKRKKKRGRR